MSKTDPKNELSSRYEEVARRFLQSQSEQDLYQASLLGRELLKEELGPTEVIQLHFNTMDSILSKGDIDSSKIVVDRLRPILLEVMMVYGESHQQVREILAELQQRYSDLDRTRHELEHSRDELRRKTSQLVQTGKMNALGELSAGVAHEINQPLNAMKIIHQDLLRDIKKDRLDLEELQESLEEAVRQIQRTAEIVDHMRRFSRKTTGAIQESLDINDPVKGVFSLIGQQLALHHIDVHKELSSGLQTTGDHVRLEQVFMNLITNARDAVSNNEKEKGKTIFIRTYSTADEQNGSAFVAFQIKDNGSGIPSDLQEKIFEPFFTSKEVGEGTGLGLSVSKQIVDEHGGRIEVQCVDGEGTTITVYLPAV